MEVTKAVAKKIVPISLFFFSCLAQAQITGSEFQTPLSSIDPSKLSFEEQKAYFTLDSVEVSETTDPAQMIATGEVIPGFNETVPTRFTALADQDPCPKCPKPKTNTATTGQKRTLGDPFDPSSPGKPDPTDPDPTNPTNPTDPTDPNDPYDPYDPNNPYPDPYDPYGGYGGYGQNDAIGKLERVVLLGQKVWQFLKENRAMVNHKYQRASALPEGAAHWTQFEDWKSPSVRTFQVVYKNAMKIEVARFMYRLVYTYGGTYEGIGKYLSNVTVIPYGDTGTTWGYTLDASTEIGEVVNIGKKRSPVAAMEISVKWRVSSIFAIHEDSHTYFVSGDGGFKSYSAMGR